MYILKFTYNLLKEIGVILARALILLCDVHSGPHLPSVQCIFGLFFTS